MKDEVVEKVDFTKEMDNIIQSLTTKYKISKSKLLNSGGGSASEFAEKIEKLKSSLKKQGVTSEKFNELFENYERS
ncbi:MAG: hypothetical protein WC998_06880 [Candidatus Paceibacterota bacterium]